MKKGRRASNRNKTSKMPFSVRFGILVAILVLAVVAAGVLMAPGFKISEVYCEGNSLVNNEEIFANAQIGNGKNIFLIGLGKSERNVEKIPMIKEADIKRVFPNKICISIKERVPLAYIKAGSECVAIDEETIIIKKIESEQATEIIRNLTPDFDKIKEEEENKTETKPEEVAEDKLETHEEHFSIPLIEGVEIKNTDENKKAKSNNEDRFNEVIKICNALNTAGLLNRATYLNVTDMQNINLVIENRLDVRLGTIDNIEYRTKFLAEVINTKISAYETLILDYTRDDIYARTFDGDEEKVKRETEKEGEAKEAEESSENKDEAKEETDSKNEEEVNNGEADSTSMKMDDGQDE